ncbi:hypothetical protein [Pontibacter sp. SGAir0037]|uniref:hypothetical protein n=1 Tax=Pontibacter sp. SGAir0037 TaxID=2571030 RepID=UPI0010CD1B46|nr:hypothetical protein [Pontibacter sp. SGAir0037]QCR21852.1 hypothetical protein C1N53_05540 [Pontibacter sp. SGAir0037]
MRKLLLLPLMLVLSLTSCKDDDEVVDLNQSAYKEQIQGNWKKELSTFRYYDASNALIYEEKDETIVNFDFNEEYARVGHYQLEPDSVVYSFPYPERPNRIKLVIPKKSNYTVEYMIENVGDNTMVFKEDNKQNATFNDGTTDRTAARMETIHNLSRREL